MSRRAAAAVAILSPIVLLAAACGATTQVTAPGSQPSTASDSSTPSGRDGSADRAPSPTEATTTGSAAPASTTPPSAVQTTPPSGAVQTTPPDTVTPRPDGSIHPGDRGPAVTAIQQQLAALGYWLGSPDGVFGTVTEQAVYALQKAAALSRDGVVGPATKAALDHRLRPTARTTSGAHVEIDLSRQLLLLVSGGRVQTILNTSTGSGHTYIEGGTQHVAVTPAGTYRIFRQVDGEDDGPLGALWRPKYFNGGIAIHGLDDVPPYPASHGCARVSDAAMNWVWATGAMPIGTTVLVFH